MFAKVIHFTRNCFECAVVTGGGKPSRPPLHPIPVQHLFQIVGVNIMEVPITAAGNKYVLAFQDYLIKWPMIFAVERFNGTLKSSTKTCSKIWKSVG